MRQHTISTTTHIPEIDWAYTPTIERNVTGKIRQGRENSIFNNPGSDSATSEDADDKVFEGRDDDLSTQPYLGITYSPTTEHGNETPETLNDIKEDASTGILFILIKQFYSLIHISCHRKTSLNIHPPFILF